MSLARKLLVEAAVKDWSAADFKAVREQLLRQSNQDPLGALSETRKLYFKANIAYKEHWGCDYVPGQLYARKPPPLSEFQNPDLAMLLAARCQGLVRTHTEIYRIYKETLTNS